MIERFTITNERTGADLLLGVNPMSISVSDVSQLMRHPTEDGSSIVDYKIDLPIEISVQVMARSGQYRDFYSRAKAAKTNADTFTIQTKVNTYRRMVIETMPHEETAALYDSIAMSLSFVEILIELPVTFNAPRNPTNANTTQRGQTQTTPATEAEGSILNGIFS